MILVHLPGGAQADWLAHALISENWKCIEALPTDDITPKEADAIVVIIDQLDTDAVDRLRMLRCIALLTPIVLCLPFERNGARELGAVSAERIVWLDDPPPVLTKAIDEVRTVPLRCRLAASILEAAVVTGRALKAIKAILCAAGRSPRTSKGVARMVGCSVASLNRSWRASVHSRTGLTVHDMIQWVVLLEAHELHVRGISWGEAASRIGTSLKTVKRAAANALGLRLEHAARLTEVDISLRLAGKMRGTLPMLRARPVREDPDRQAPSRKSNAGGPCDAPPGETGLDPSWTHH